MSLFSNFPQGGKKAGVQSISDGGTGATTAEAALANLGGFPKADGEALKTRIQPINLGGTGASEANEARQNLGAAAVKEMTKAEYDALPTIDPTIFYALTDVEADGVKIEVGSYVGTGVCGPSNPTTLTFGFEPKLFILCPNNRTANGSIPYSTVVIRGNSWLYKNSNEANRTSLLTWSGNKVSWYIENTNSTYAQYQFNSSNATYYYAAIG